MPITAGAARRVLLIGADCVSRLTDPDDRATAVLFADGAGAVVLEASDDDGLLAVDLGVDGSAHDLLTCAHGGYMAMEGKEVFRRAVRITVESASNALDRAKLAADDIALFVPHQANLRIIEAAADASRASPWTAWPSSSTGRGTPRAPRSPWRSPTRPTPAGCAPGDHVLMSGFGAGMAWASAVVRWAADTTRPDAGSRHAEPARRGDAAR